MKHGFVLINKEEGPTSFGIVSKLKRKLGTKKIGHCGTLDPLAEGLLLIAVGNATKFIQFVDNDKSYEFVVCFGKRTDTGDREGEVIEECAHIPVKNELLAVMNSFVGEIMQTPPAYSAIKINGERAYKLAREGKEVNIAERKTTIFSLELLDFNFKLGIAKLVAHCSNGTYIRTLAEDIAKHCGTVGFCLSIKRTSIGKLKLENSCSVEDVTEENVVGISEVIKFPKLKLYANNAQKIKNGNFIPSSLYDKKNITHILLEFEGEIIALGKIDREEIKPVFVFNK